MDQKDGMTLAPVIGWSSSTVTAYGVGFFNFEYVVSPTETAAQAHKSPNFALTPEQLRELGQRMLFLADILEKTPETSAGSPQH